MVTALPDGTRSNATGHTYLVKRKRGDQWYVEVPAPGWSQVQKRLGCKRAVETRCLID